MTSTWQAPPASDEWAIFLDLDGTLVDIAPTPHSIKIHSDLPPLLAKLSRRLGGSVAFVSGRSIADLDLLMHPLHFPAAGIHGIERRDARGDLHYAGLAPEDLEPARVELRNFVSKHSGLLLEDKGRSLALHFRLAPELESAVYQIIEHVLQRLPVETHVQPGHCVIEIKSGRANKRTAIEQFMQEPPFAGRVPIFVGDDLTDRDGFTYVESIGGHAVLVGPDPEEGRGWLPDPAAVHQWLQTLTV
jgi:trehalose 6-phosphate phosphatase